MSLHEHYDRLTDTERSAVDESWSALLGVMREHNVRMESNDVAEVAVDAIARAVIQSRLSPAPSSISENNRFG